MLGHPLNDLVTTCPHTKQGWTELGAWIATPALAVFAWWIGRQRPDDL